jgi:2-oxoglutarate ferredoxin oxidoreductase subunit gamma
MIERIIIAGSGGQGIVLLAKVLAEAAMLEDKFVTCLPSYRAEVRGGTSFCMVVISDSEAGSPFIDKADALIIMNSLSLKRFEFRLKHKGLFISNESLASRSTNTNAEILSYPFTDMAARLGNLKVSNMVALGCYLAKKKIINIKNILMAIEKIIPKNNKDLIRINKQAVFSGMELIK